MGRPRKITATPEEARKLEIARRNNRKRKARLRPLHQQILADFLSRECEDCGVQYPLPAMHADHVRGKKHKIGWFRDGNGSPELLKQELERCEVRCANCHILRHAREDQWPVLFQTHTPR